jgi:hypothetical protein
MDKEDHSAACGIIDTSQDPSQSWCGHYEQLFSELANDLDLPIEKVRRVSQFVLNFLDTTPGINYLDIQSNCSALMYIITEQQALLGNLLQELVKNGHISGVQLDKITDMSDKTRNLTPVYSDLYKKFLSYFLHVRDLLLKTREADRGISKPFGPPKGEDTE